MGSLKCKRKHREICHLFYSDMLPEEMGKYKIGELKVLFS